MKDIPDVGEIFDVETFTDRIKDCGVDYLVFHARCNQGLAYYNTLIGTKHPSLKYDLFGKLAEVCQRKGIALGAYFNAGISTEEGLQHREWTTLYFDGRSLREPRFTPQVRTMCYNSKYRDHLIEMVKEVLYMYPVAGLMIDCLINYPCVCPICVEEMKKRNIDWSDFNAVTRFAEISAIRLAKDIAEEAKKINPHLLISTNYPSYEELKDINSYYDVVSLPASDGGYEFMPVMAHYVRTLGDYPILNMTGRFCEWGDFGGLLPEEAIKSELLYGLANGMRPNIGSHFHLRGDLKEPVLERIKKIYTGLQAKEEWYDGAKPVTEIAIVYPRSIHHIRKDKELRAAVRMLSELKQQFDVVTLASDWGKYKVLIFPDDIVFDDETATRVKTHLNKGKIVISTGFSGLDPEKKHFALEQEWGIKFLGENQFDPAYFVVGEEYNKGLPEMPLSLYSNGIEIEASGKTKIGAFLVKPYYNRGWDGKYAFYYNPPDKVTEKPAITISGQVAHFSHRIFSGYYDKASVELKTIFSNVLNQYFPKPLIKTDSLPSYARVFVTEQPGRRMVHLLSYMPEMRGNTPIIEESIELNNITISLRNDDKDYKNIYLAPEKKGCLIQLKEVIFI
ncbi:MAG: beta-galactosidase trimerization domain-containing protein [Candidatus Cloacimonetes bacterium]|nr:beta-galactosidase trimerization domain-containing protein [Candidatus Cloacimonadota bacterium]MDD3868887.1 beta-galactosidase trimerization domain-containing protein [Candidatus Cloacimonadota bacterium]